MSADMSMIVADASRLAAIRAGVQLPGRVTHFTAGNLSAALESIRAYRPRLVAIDAVFAQTAEGAAFADRVEAIGGIAVRLVLRRDGKWVTTAREVQAAPAAGSIVVAPPAIEVPQANTRRAPRFRLLMPLEAKVEGGRATLVDLSVHGAQVVSFPPLRPNQKIKVALEDTDDVLNLTAQVAWSCFQQAISSPDPFYRVGLEFTSASQQTLDAYRMRYCADKPISISR